MLRRNTNVALQKRRTAMGPEKRKKDERKQVWKLENVAMELISRERGGPEVLYINIIWFIWNKMMLV